MSNVGSGPDISTTIKHAASRMGVSADWLLPASDIAAVLSGRRFGGNRRPFLWLIQARITETVHPQCPLIADQSPFDARQQPQTEQYERRHPDHELNPRRWRIELF